MPESNGVKSAGVLATGLLVLTGAAMYGAANSYPGVTPVVFGNNAAWKSRPVISLTFQRMIITFLFVLEKFVF